MKLGRSFTGIRGHCFGWLSASKKKHPTWSRAQKSLNITRQSFNDWLQFGKQHGCCCLWLLRSSSFLIASIVWPWFLVELIHHTCMIIVRCCMLCASSVHLVLVKSSTSRSANFEILWKISQNFKFNRQPPVKHVPQSVSRAPSTTMLAYCISMTFPGCSIANKRYR